VYLVVSVAEKTFDMCFWSSPWRRRPSTCVFGRLHGGEDLRHVYLVVSVVEKTSDTCIWSSPWWRRPYTQVFGRFWWGRGRWPSAKTPREPDFKERQGAVSAPRRRLSLRRKRPDFRHGQDTVLRNFGREFVRADVFLPPAALLIVHVYFHVAESAAGVIDGRTSLL